MEDPDLRKFEYFHSEEMSLCQLFVKTEAAYRCISELGEVGLVQFNSMQREESQFQLKFSPEVVSCAEMDRVICFLQKELAAASIPIPELHDEDIPLTPDFKELADLRITLKELEADLLEIVKYHDVLQDKYHHLLEVSTVLEKTAEHLRDSASSAWSDTLPRMSMMSRFQKNDDIKLGYVTGTISTEALFKFEQVLWRVCRGNYYMRHAYIRESRLESLNNKIVFVIFFQGEAIKERVHKICHGFPTKLHQLPESSHDRLTMLQATEETIEDLEVVLQQTDNHRRSVLETVAADLPSWRVQVRKAMAVYHVMNQMVMGEGEHFLIAECWIPTADIPLIQRTLYKAAVSAGSTVPPIIGRLPTGSRIPPTYHRGNRVLRGFQNLVDSYGVGRYQELNPATYTMVTFPFLFAVMFGDLGHGLLMAMFATWLVAKERSLGRLKLHNEIWNIIFAGRYILLGMGLFSIYTGSIYNDVFSKSIKFFSSAWGAQYNTSTVLLAPIHTMDPKYDYRRYPYPFGMDPVWNASGEAAIIAMNSFKMKLAIILGVTQMIFGLLLGARNHIYFGNYVDLFGMCIPQLIFFSLFVYLAALILLKWAWYSAENPPPYDIHCAPSILITFINMLLFKRHDKVKTDCAEFMFKNQFVFQRCLVIVAMLCIPVMLFAKPVCILIKKRQQEQALLEAQRAAVYKYMNGRGGDVPEEESSSTSFSYTSEDDTVKTNEGTGPELSEVFIHQGIHTIEAVLGAVSHTASYLRLWALSLAHDQLSTVLWNMVMRKGFSVRWRGSIMLYFIFLIWAVLTVAILVVMEGLSAFLHTLRLHWVEFQSKFYSGTGTPFQPFYFKKILTIDEEDG